MRKRGQTQLLETIIFVVLNLVFFCGLLYFVYHSGSTNGVYEEALAKKAALAADRIEPGMRVYIGVSNEIELAQKAGIKTGDIFSAKNGNIKVTLSSLGGYDFNYFSDYQINFTIRGSNLVIEAK